MRKKNDNKDTIDLLDEHMNVRRRDDKENECTKDSEKNNSNSGSSGSGSGCGTSNEIDRGCGTTNDVHNTPKQQDLQDKQLNENTLSTKHVRFSSIEWKEYGITVGINPSCHNGPALELADWSPKYIHEPVPIDSYEEEQRRSSFDDAIDSDPSYYWHSPPRSSRFHKEENMNNPSSPLSVMERENLLLENGLTSHEIWKTTKEKDLYIKKIHHHRHFSLQDSALLQAMHLIPPSSPFNKRRMAKAHKKRLEVLKHVNNNSIGSYANDDEKKVLFPKLSFDTDETKTIPSISRSETI